MEKESWKGMEKKGGVAKGRGGKEGGEVGREVSGEGKGMEGREGGSSGAIQLDVSMTQISYIILKDTKQEGGDKHEGERPHKQQTQGRQGGPQPAGCTGNVLQLHVMLYELAQGALQRHKRCRSHPLCWAASRDSETDIGFRV